MAKRSKETSSEAVVAITPDLLAQLDPELQAALQIALDKQRLEEQAKEIARLKDDMYVAASALLEAGCVHVLDEDAISPPWYRDGYFDVSKDPLPTGDMYEPLTFFFSDLYGHEFASRRFSPDSETPSPIIAYHPYRDKPLVRYDFFEDLMEAGREEETYIYFGKFFIPDSGFLTVKKNMMRTLSGFAVDIDRRKFDDGTMANMDYYISVLIKRISALPQALQPNYVLLSGTAAQLWYIFEEPIMLQSKKSRRRDRYDKLYRATYSFFANLLPPNAVRVDVGCASINHAFRAPYTMSKHGFQTALYRWPKEERTNVLELSEAVGGGLRHIDTIPIDKALYEKLKLEREEQETQAETEYATDKQLAFIDSLHASRVLSDKDIENADSFTLKQADAVIKKGLVKLQRAEELRKSNGMIDLSDGRKIPHKPRHEKLYENVLKRIREETKPGARYLALFVLATYAWNCCIPPARLERDMRELQNDDWGRKGGHDGKPISDDDVKSAMLGYTPLAALRKRHHNEQMLEWSFGEPQPRNHQSRWTHLQADEWVIDGKRKVNVCKANRERNPGGRPKGSVKESTSKGEAIRAYAAEHPELSNRQIAQALGVSRNTVNKWLKKEG